MVTDESYRPSGRLVVVLALTALPVSIGLVWIATMRLDGVPSFLVSVLASTIAIGAGVGPTLVHGWRSWRRDRIERPEAGS